MPRGIQVQVLLSALLLRDAGRAAIHSRGISAVGSAQHWQCWGQGFESPMLHKKKAAEELLFSLRKRVTNPNQRSRVCSAKETGIGAADEGALGIRTERQHNKGT